MKKIIFKLWAKYLPIYAKIPFTKNELAIWAHSPNWKSLRITIRDADGLWMATIKYGDYIDPYRCSSSFSPTLKRLFGKNKNHTSPDFD